jgi:hypothetical protein
VNRQWVRNIQKTLQFKLSIGGEYFSGTARFAAQVSFLLSAEHHDLVESHNVLAFLGR